MTSAFVHASCVVIGEAGVLIRGASGAGKSTLARRLIDAALARGVFARLVADDRVLLSPASGRIVARPHDAVRDLIEIRGLGLAAVSGEYAAVVRLVVDLTDADPPRLPTTEDATAEVAGVPLPRLAGRPQDEDRVLGAMGLGSWSPNPKR